MTFTVTFFTTPSIWQNKHDNREILRSTSVISLHIIFEKLYWSRMTFHLHCITTCTQLLPWWIHHDYCFFAGKTKGCFKANLSFQIHVVTASLHKRNKTHLFIANVAQKIIRYLYAAVKRTWACRRKPGVRTPPPWREKQIKIEQVELSRSPDERG